MKSFRTNRDELEAVRCFPERLRPDWPVVLSVSAVGQIWLWKRWGNTPLPERVYVRGRARIVDAIADEDLTRRPTGGRIFIDDRGAFYSPEVLGMKLSDIQIVAFEISE